VPDPADARTPRGGDHGDEDPAVRVRGDGFVPTRDEVSRLDYFHPDLDGQAALARITWPVSWWP
jgi:hypothetical protein